MNLRLLACDFIFSVLKKERSLLTLDKALPDSLSSKQRGQIKNLSYQYFRYYFRLKHHLDKLALRHPKPYSELLLMMAILEKFILQSPNHAIVDGYVEIAKTRLNQHQANFINATTRKLITLAFDDVLELEAPDWLMGKLRKFYPQEWESILAHSNHQAPVFIRINQQYDLATILQQLDAEGIAYLSTPLPYCFKLVDATAIHLHPLFIDGKISIQDLSPQYAAEILQIRAIDTVLDACAAPGGKTAHLLEKCPNVHQLVATDIHPKRLSMVSETIQRLRLSDSNVELVCGDITEPMSGMFDKILLDAPCSATGVIRRNPDIKVLRQAEDVNQIAEVQAQALKNLWNNLKPNGVLLYATCSILPQENDKQIAKFLALQPDAELVDIPLLADYKAQYGYQILPDNGDGFYYCLLRKLRLESRENKNLQIVTKGEL